MLLIDGNKITYNWFNENNQFKTIEAVAVVKK